MPYILAESWVHKHDHQLTAIGVVVAAFAAVWLVDRLFARRARVVALRLTGGELSREATTRLRFLRRAIEAVVIVIAIGIALSQFEAFDRVGRTILASGAIAAAVVGFAARQTLANAVAGIMLAVTQPIRIGDLITFEGETGTVEDVGLTYTWLRTGANARIVIPNERLAGGILRNDSIRSPAVATEVSVWVEPGTDETRAVDAIMALGVQARIAEVTHEGMRLLAMGDPGPASERLAREGDLRVAVLRALREAGCR